jgi:hypothetical protein
MSLLYFLLLFGGNRLIFSANHKVAILLLGRKTKKTKKTKKSASQNLPPQGGAFYI